MSQAQLAAVRDFSVTKPGVGRIRWLRPVDLRDADLNRALTLTPGYAIIDAPAAAPSRAMLNMPCEVTLYGLTAAMLDEAVIDEAALRDLAKKIEVTFVGCEVEARDESGRAASMSLTFNVPGWSGRGLPLAAARARQEHRDHINSIMSMRRSASSRPARAMGLPGAGLGHGASPERGAANSDDEESEEPETMAEAALVSDHLHLGGPKDDAETAADVLWPDYRSADSGRQGIGARDDEDEDDDDDDDDARAPVQQSTLEVLGALVASSARKMRQVSAPSAWASGKAVAAHPPSQSEVSGRSIGQARAEATDSEDEDADAKSATYDNSDGSDSEAGSDSPLDSAPTGQQRHGTKAAAAAAAASQEEDQDDDDDEEEAADGAYEEQGVVAARHAGFVPPLPIEPAGFGDGAVFAEPVHPLAHLGELSETIRAATSRVSDLAAPVSRGVAGVSAEREREEDIPVYGLNSGVPVDAALVLGRSFRVGWGAGGVMVHPGRPLSGVQAVSVPGGAPGAVATVPWVPVPSTPRLRVTIERVHTVPSFSGAGFAGVEVVKQTSAAAKARALDPIMHPIFALSPRVVPGPVAAGHGSDSATAPAAAAEAEAEAATSVASPSAWLVDESAVEDLHILAAPGDTDEEHSLHLARLAAQLQASASRCAQACERETAAAQSRLGGLVAAYGIDPGAADQDPRSSASHAQMAALGTQAASHRHASRLFAAVSALFCDPAAVEAAEAGHLDPAPHASAPAGTSQSALSRPLDRDDAPAVSGKAASAARVVLWRRQRILSLLQTWATDALGRHDNPTTGAPVPLPGQALSLVPGGALTGPWAGVRRALACGDAASASRAASAVGASLPRLAVLLAQAGSSPAPMADARAQLEAWRAERLLPPTAMDVRAAMKAFIEDHDDQETVVANMLAVAEVCGQDTAAAAEANERVSGYTGTSDAELDALRDAADGAFNDLLDAIYDSVGALGAAVERSETASLIGGFREDLDSGVPDSPLHGLRTSLQAVSAPEAAQIPRSVAWLTAVAAGEVHSAVVGANTLPWHCSLLMHAQFAAAAAQDGSLKWPELEDGEHPAEASKAPAATTGAWLARQRGVMALSLPACLARFVVAARGGAAAVPHPWHFVQRQAEEGTADPVTGITHAMSPATGVLVATGQRLAALPMTLEEEAESCEAPGVKAFSAHAAVSVQEDAPFGDAEWCHTRSSALEVLDFDYAAAAAASCDMDSLLEIPSDLSAAEARLEDAIVALSAGSAGASAAGSGHDGEQGFVVTAASFNAAILQALGADSQAGVVQRVPCMRDAVYLLLRLHASSADPALPGAARDIAPALPATSSAEELAGTAVPAGMSAPLVKSLFEPDAHGPDALDARLPFALMVLLRRSRVLISEAEAHAVASVSAAEEAQVRRGPGAQPTEAEVQEAVSRLPPSMPRELAEAITRAACLQLEAEGQWTDALGVLLVAAAPPSGALPSEPELHAALSAGDSDPREDAQLEDARLEGAARMCPGIGGFSRASASGIARSILERNTPCPAAQPEAFREALASCRAVGLPLHWLHAAAARRLLAGPAPFASPTLPSGGLPQLLECCHQSRSPQLLAQAHSVIVALAAPTLLLPRLHSRQQWLVSVGTDAAVAVGAPGHSSKASRAGHSLRTITFPALASNPDTPDSANPNSARAVALWDMLLRLSWLQQAQTTMDARSRPIPEAAWATGGHALLSTVSALDEAFAALATAVSVLAEATREGPSADSAELCPAQAALMVSRVLPELEAVESLAATLGQDVPAVWKSSDRHNGSLQATRGSLAREATTLIHRLNELMGDLQVAHDAEEAAAQRQGDQSRASKRAVVVDDWAEARHFASASSIRTSDGGFASKIAAICGMIEGVA
jgi:nuclear pore complex protein Nup98-Nup96